MGVKVEYVQWYEAGTHLARCLSCGALVSSADTETHTNWHGRVGA